MNKHSEIIFQDTQIDKIPDHLNLKVGDKFYFSLRNPSPRSEQEFRDSHKDYENKFLNTLITKIKNDCNKFWIMEFIVTDVCKSYMKNYFSSIENPEVTYVEIITVEEYQNTNDSSIHEMD